MSEEIKEIIAKWKRYIKHMEPWHDKYVERQKLLVNYIEQLQQENEHNKYILIEFEKWLEEKLNIKPANKIYVSECLYKLQELKEGKK